MAAQVRLSVLVAVIVFASCAPAVQSGPSAPQAPRAIEGGPCVASELHVVVLCTPVGGGGIAPPQLLGPDRRPEACVQSEEGTATVARLEAQVDTQGRLARVRVAKSGTGCDQACIEAAYRRAFQPVLRDGRSVSGEATLLCRRKVVGIRSGPTRS